MASCCATPPRPAVGRRKKGPSLFDLAKSDQQQEIALVVAEAKAAAPPPPPPPPASRAHAGVPDAAIEALLGSTAALSARRLLQHGGGPQAVPSAAATPPPATAATRAKARAALLDGLRTGELAKSVSTLNWVYESPGPSQLLPATADLHLEEEEEDDEDALDDEIDALRHELDAALSEKKDLERTVAWLHDVVTREGHEAAASDEPEEVTALIAQLLRATEDLRVARVTVAEAHGWNNELEQAMLELAADYRMRLAKRESEQEHSVALSSSQSRALENELKLAREWTAHNAHQLQRYT